jgi:glycosyltransferase involved in cell wall biosynthesis
MSTVSRPGPVVVIGDPGAVFVQLNARVWRELGEDVVIATARLWQGPDVLPDGTPVLAVNRTIDPGLARETSLLVPILQAMEAELGRLPDPDRAEAQAGWGAGKALPSVVPIVTDALQIAEAVRALGPRLVFGHEATAYGLATALCFGCPRAIMVWGGDVQFFADASPVSRALARYCLQSVETVVVGSPGLSERAVSHFGVRPSRIVTFSFGVDRAGYRPPTAAERDEARRRLGLPSAVPVVTNLRRFDPYWGSDDALDAFVTVAALEPDAHFVLVGGTGNESRIAEARARAADAGLGDRLHVLAGQLPAETYRLVLRASDLGVSLTRWWDEPLSWSVLQAMATGLPVVTSGQRVYREAAASGAGIVPVDAGEPGETVRALAELLRDATRARALASSSAGYLEVHQDQAAAVAWLLARLERPEAGHPPRPTGLAAHAAGQ